MGLGIMEVVIVVITLVMALAMIGVGLLILLGIPVALAYMGIAKSRGRLRAMWLGAAGLYVFLVVLLPIGIYGIALYSMNHGKLESGGRSRTYRADGSCTEERFEGSKTSSVLHQVCPVAAPTR
jgi:hypothetical protein